MCEFVLINILMLKLGPETKILSSTPSKVNDDVETLLFPLRTTLDLIGFFFFLRERLDWYLKKRQ